MVRDQPTRCGIGQSGILRPFAAVAGPRGALVEWCQRHGTTALFAALNVPTMSEMVDGPLSSTRR